MDETLTVIDTMRTGGSNGYWQRDLERTPRKYVVRVEHPDYETGEMKVEMKNLHRNRYLELSTLLMKRRFVLDEVVVTASIVKIAYKGDTIEVNANAFNIPEGSMLSGLVGSIPGCELKPNGGNSDERQAGGLPVAQRERNSSEATTASCSTTCPII